MIGALSSLLVEKLFEPIVVFCLSVTSFPKMAYGLTTLPWAP
jgi:hypothetical protein